MSDLRCYSREFLTEVIEIFRNSPCIWKMKSKEYSDRFAREKAFGVLIEKFQEVEADATKDTVQKKIYSLRNSWRKEVRKVRSSKISGASEEDMYKPQLWYFDLLSFLDDQETTSRSPTILDEDNEETEDLPPSDDCPSSVPSPTIPVGQMRSKSVKRVQEDASEVLGLVKQRFTKPNNPFENLGKHWAEKMHSLRGQQRIFAEKLINDVLYEAELGRLSHGCHIFSGPYPSMQNGSCSNFLPQTQQFAMPQPTLLQQYSVFLPQPAPAQTYSPQSHPIPSMPRQPHPTSSQPYISPQYRPTP